MSDPVIIANMILTFLGTVFTGIMAFLIARLNQKQTAATVRVDEVKQELVENNQAVAKKVAEVAVKVEDIRKVKVETLNVLASLGEKIEEVHRATNSLTDRLVETTRVEAHAAGVKEGKKEAGP